MSALPSSGTPLGGLDRRIQAYLHAHASRAPDHERFGVFLASFDRDSDNPYLSYAIPDDASAPSTADIGALVAGFSRWRRRARLEYIANAAPCVEAALIAHGFAVEKRYPILVCTPSQLKGRRTADGYTLELARSDDDIVAAAAALADAFGESVPRAEPLIRMTAQGGVLIVAQHIASGMVVGAGIATPPHDGVSEVAGIGVRAAFRNQGVAGALTSAITRHAFARGVTLAWLTPGDDGPERVYARAGFARASEQLHISLS